MVMTHCGTDSSNLKVHFKTDKSFKIVFKLGQSILKALEKMHDIGYAHCDVKPSNIMACEDANNFTLIDFGICSQYHVDGIHIVKEQIKHFNGSVEFAANDIFDNFSKIFVSFKSEIRKFFEKLNRIS